jgi:hypothetical protein
MLDVAKYSIITLGKVEELLVFFKQKVLKYKSLVDIEFGIGDTLIRAYYINNRSFYFNVLKPTEEGVSVTKQLRVNYKPQNIGTIMGAKSDLDYSVIPNTFESWINILKQYEKIDLNKFQNDFTKVFEKEVYDDFEILDEDASYMPFDAPRIEFWYKYLSYIEDVVKQEPEQNRPEIKELLNDVTELKNNLGTSTKAEVVSKYAKLVAKAKKIGTNVGLAFWDVAKKEAIKHILKIGYEQLPTIGHAISDFVTSLPPIHTIPL